MFQIQWLYDKRSKMGKTDNKFGDQFDSISMPHPAICETTTGTAGLVVVPGICDINIIGIPPDTSFRTVPSIIVQWELQQRCIYPAKVSHGTWKWHPGIEDSFLKTIIFGFHVKLGECNESCKKTLKISHPKRKKSSSNHPFSGASFFWFQGG